MVNRFEHDNLIPDYDYNKVALEPNYMQQKLEVYRLDYLYQELFLQ
ncbi:hypothetical protein WG8_4076 [Paenibacillus sp. Aloe-11]|nr:hypothetical protein WG8_4076 [Paenibacillus sp. Aloe-11]